MLLRRPTPDASYTGVTPPLPQPGEGELADLHEIQPGLFLGSWRAGADAALLRELRITHVINLSAADTEFRWGGIEHRVTTWPQVSGGRLDIAAKDEPTYALDEHFNETSSFLTEALVAGRVLVHCRAGASRSATIVIAFLMTVHGLSLPAADSLTTSRRADCSPNSGFTEQLRQLDASLHAADASLIFTAHAISKGDDLDVLEHLERAIGLGTGVAGRGSPATGGSPDSIRPRMPFSPSPTASPATDIAWSSASTL